MALFIDDLALVHQKYRTQATETFPADDTIQYNAIFVYWGLTERKLNNRGYSLRKLIYTL